MQLLLLYGFQTTTRVKGVVLAVRLIMSRPLTNNTFKAPLQTRDQDESIIFTNFSEDKKKFFFFQLIFEPWRGLGKCLCSTSAAHEKLPKKR